jgi:hypothetical protein
MPVKHDLIGNGDFGMGIKQALKQGRPRARRADHKNRSWVCTGRWRLRVCGHPSALAAPF